MSDNATVTANDAEGGEELVLHGVLAEFDNVDDLIHACEKVRDAGYKKWDAHSPFPVHGIDPAMGIKNTILPWLVLGGGITGLGIAVLMQWWMNAVDYPFVISGKPFFSFPACVPIMFELTVLLSALTAFGATLALNLLPRFHHPIFGSERFLRATDDRFFIAIDDADPNFDRQRTSAFLSELSTYPVEEIFDTKHHAPIPMILPIVGVVSALFSFVPLLVIVKARYTTSDTPPVHIVWDMDWQAKVKAQRASALPVFEDGRGYRPQVASTIASGQFYEDDQVPYMEGRVLDPSTVTNADGWVESIPIPAHELPARMARGQERFGIFCAPCHGLSGNGQGIVNLRATMLQESDRASGWVPPASLHSDDLRSRAVGEIFNTISHGKNTMPAYASQIPVADRWNIILYIRALQRSQWAETADAPATMKGDLETMILNAPEPEAPTGG